MTVSPHLTIDQVVAMFASVGHPVDYDALTESSSTVHDFITQWGTPGSSGDWDGNPAIYVWRNIRTRPSGTPGDLIVIEHPTEAGRTLSVFTGTP